MDGTFTYPFGGSIGVGSCAAGGLREGKRAQLGQKLL